MRAYPCLAAAPGSMGLADGGGAGPDRVGSAGAAVCGPAPDAGAAQPETGGAVGHAAPQDRALHRKTHPVCLPGCGPAGADCAPEGGKELSQRVRPAVAVRDRRVSGRHGGDGVLPRDGRRVDEPFQSWY